MPAASRIQKLLVQAAVGLALGTTVTPGLDARAQATAAPAPSTTESYAVEVKIIEARQKTGAGTPTALEPALAPLAGDLGSLPFEGFRLVDTVQKELHGGEAFTVQFGSPERRRFVRATAHGKDKGKVKLDVVMERNAGRKTKNEFKSDVSIPEAGTLVLVATKKGAPADTVVLLAISARTITGGTAPAAAGSSSSLGSSGSH